MLFSFAAYGYFWFFDHWKQVKKSVFYKSLLILQTLIVAALFVAML
jgi:hypothetical protein